ncbi:MAG: helix-turn-helix domain-containing protein, partial [Polaromonas sp.]|nr:helix-turn-helix domain-containing protein [Polaromonas sp.]
GNVRQLENICHWLTVMAPAQVIEPKDLPPEVLSATPDVVRALAPAEKTEAIKPEWAAVPENAPDAPQADAPVAGVACLPLAGLDQSASNWESGLEAEAQALLATGRTDVWDVLTRRFESKLIQTALVNTRGRRIEAAQKLGIGRNTITRKIQELNLE